MKINLLRKLVLAFCPFVYIMPSYSQVYLSNVKSNGKIFFNNGNALTVENGSSGWGYKAFNAAKFYHNGPAAATLTVNGVFDSYNLTPVTPAVDYFNGLNGATSPAEIAGTVAPVFGELYFGNGDNISITNTAGIIIGKQLTLSNKITTTVRSNPTAGAVYFMPGADYSSTTSLSDLQYVNGYVTKEGNTPFIFPVGDQLGADMRTLTISATSSAGNIIAVSYWKGDVSTSLDPTGGSHDRMAVSAAGVMGSTKILSVSPVGFWDFVPLNGNDPVTITVSIPDLSQTEGYGNSASIRLVGWNTTTNAWENLSDVNAISSTAEGTPLTGTVNDMSLYSAIGIGSTELLALPLTLTSFTVSATGCTAKASWQTSFENNLTAFELEYSSDGSNFFRLTEKPASNNSLGERYEQVINTLPQGDYFIRLKTKESDGGYSYSAVKKVKISCSAEAIHISPNPAASFIKISGTDMSNAQIMIYNAQGQLVYGAASSEHNQTIDIGKWPDGLYLVQVKTNSGKIAQKQIIKN